MLIKWMAAILLLAGFTAHTAAEPMQLVFSISSGHSLIALPLYGTVACTVDWGNSASPDTITTPGDHYSAIYGFGTYDVTITISGTVTQFGKGGSFGYTADNQLKEVVSFGDIGLTSLAGAFYDSDNLESVPAVLPSTVTDLSFAFSTSSRSTIANLDAWNVSNVTNMRGIFASAANFDQDISGWDVSGVTDMQRMFAGADAFNRDIGGWNTSAVTDMSYMFMGTEAFDQNIGGWDVSNVTDMTNIFLSATLSTANYDSLLIGWAAGGVQDSVTFNGGSSEYSVVSDSARQILAETCGWTITDGGLYDTPPVITSAGADTAMEDLPYVYIATVTDPDDVPTIRFDALPSWLTANGDTVSGTPTEGVTGTSFQVIADDGTTTERLTVQLEVLAVNDPPVITSAAADTAREGSFYYYEFAAVDPDGTPVITLKDYPGWLSVSGAWLMGTPPAGAGDTSFVVIASDGELADTVTVQLHVMQVDGISDILLRPGQGISVPVGSYNLYGTPATGRGVGIIIMKDENGNLVKRLRLE